MSWRTTRASARGEAEPRNVAVIDLGSNSWRLVVYTYGTDGAGGVWWKRTDELYEAVRIGEGVAASHSLGEAAMARGLETLTVFERFCRANNLLGDDVHVFATSAIRDADNRDEYLARIRKTTGYEVELLSAEQEAYYGYVATVNSTTLTNGVVLDIGGGSLQLVRVEERLQRDTVSFRLGAVRMTERFLAEGNPRRGATKKDLQRLRSHVERKTSSAAWLPGIGGRLVATGGAVRNLAAAAQRAEFGGSGGIDIGVQGYLITADALDQLTAAIAALPVGERHTIPGIKPGRADIILAAAVTLQTVLRVGGFSGIEVTEAGLREGIFLARTILDPELPLFTDVRAATVRNLATQYESDLTHTEHVALLSLQMHESLVQSGVFEPAPGEAELLWAAAMLHDVGVTISYDDHHKHSRYLIMSADLLGFDPRERVLIAQIARYHRKGAAKLGEWASVTKPGDEQLLERCALILRLAEHLERGRDQIVSEARLRTNGDGFALHLLADGDLTLPRWSVERYFDDQAFERVFHRPLIIG